MKYFVAYRFSGEDREVLRERMQAVVDALSEIGMEAYCNLFDQHEYESVNLSAKEIMQKAFARIDESDGLFVLLASNDKSEGQLMEVGYTIATNKPIIAAVQTDVTTYVDQLAATVIRWQDLADLRQQIAGLHI